MRKTAVVGCLAALAAVVSAQTVRSPQKPGKWQITMEMEMPGMPMKMPPIMTEVCVTEADLAKPEPTVPKDAKSQCNVGDYKIKGNTVTWTVDCPKQKTKGSGEITYKDDTFSGQMKMQTADKEMSTKYTGKWLGTCTK
jgi:Protein of unknown function (DUF3617)